MIHHSTFWITASADSVRRMNGSAFSHVEARGSGERAGVGVDAAAHAEAQEVRGHEAGQEVPPGADGVGVAGLELGLRGVGAGLQRHAEHDADGHRDERGDREPQQGLTGQACGVRDLSQADDARHDRGEDERHDGGAQQRDVAAADGGEGGVQAVLVALGIGAERHRDAAEHEAEDQGGEDLPAERRHPLGEAAPRFGGGRSCRHDEGFLSVGKRGIGR
jgi:hypothetical protein